jgi:Ca2+-binding RTX toxin-like protein
MVDRTGTQFNDNLVGENGNDTLSGLGGNDFLLGLSGDDFLFGGSGRDTLRGGAGVDQLFGGSGNDILQGTNISFSTTNELEDLTGGLGADTFVLGDAFNVYYLNLDTGSRFARILDFQRSEGDKIQLKGSASDYELSSIALPNTTFINTIDGDTIGQVNRSNLSFAQDFIFV